jgi:UDP-N-acetylmuramoyl-tripeptide--D-alanyl-D-alanine ligase
LFAGLAGGVAVINADDVYAPLWRELSKNSSTLTFGFSDQADVRALHAQPVPAESPTGTRFELRAPEGRQTVNLPLPGRHNVCNALAAAACGVALGMDLADIAAGLARMDAPQGRLSWKNTPEGARLLDDSYNANPTSLRAGMELLASLSGERVLVLGGMAELGDNAVQLHFDAGASAKALRIDRLYTLGPMAAQAAKGFGTGGHAFEDFNELAAALRPHLNKNVTLLVKGSRSSRMERVVAALTGEGAKGDH